MMPLVPRHWLDIGRCDLLRALTQATHAGDAAVREAAIVERWAPDAIACLSVRSGFDLLLSALDLPAGSEVIMSAINIPDMVRIMRAHRLVPVPVDTLMPPPGALDRTFTRRTRAVMFAHLFGARGDAGEWAAFARRNGLLLIEDAAQAFQGPDYWGDPRADVSLWSFGIIKTATAIGGGLLVVRDPKLRERMRRIQAGWPAQAPSAYAKRAALLLAMSMATRNRWPYGALVRAFEALGKDIVLILAPTRGFASDDDDVFFATIRRRPCAALLSLLYRRLDGFDVGRLARRAEAGERVALAVGRNGGMRVLGAQQPNRTHWLMPVVASEPAALVTRLRRDGFDATWTATNLTAFGPTESKCVRAMRNVVYVPSYPEMGTEMNGRLIASLARNQGADLGKIGAAIGGF